VWGDIHNQQLFCYTSVKRPSYPQPEYCSLGCVLIEEVYYSYFVKFIKAAFSTLQRIYETEASEF